MSIENIQQTYNVQELMVQRETLKNQLNQDGLSDEEKWEVDFMIQLVNQRIRLMTDLLVGIPLEVK